MAARDRAGAAMSAADSAPYAEVIGDPIAQSKSPLIHGFWLDALGMKGAYRRAHVKPDDLAAYIAERRTDPGWRGCNAVSYTHLSPSSTVSCAQVSSAAPRLRACRLFPRSTR